MPSIAQAISAEDSPIERPRLEQNPTSDTTSPEEAGARSSTQRAIERGGRAARQVYDTLELRRKVLVLLDKRTLAGFLQVERAATTSVAEVLYREVQSIMMGKMSRATPRRVAYCDAVRVLDRSPPPRISNLHQIPKRGDKSPRYPVRFEPTLLIRDLKAWRKKYPNLLRIDYLYPANDHDDAYVVHLGADVITVELESHVQVELLTYPWVAPILPPTPVFEGMVFQHTIALQVAAGDVAIRRPWLSDHNAVTTLLDKWKDHLYHNSDLDGRITSIEERTYGGNLIKVSFEDYLSFISLRESSGAEPFAKFYAKVSYCTLSSERMVELSDALPSGLRVLHFHVSGPGAIIHTTDVQFLINKLDHAHPTLHELRLSYSPEDHPDWSSPDRPLIGMSHLRRLILDDEIDETPEDVARWLRKFGGKGCAIQSTANDTMKEMEQFNALVAEWRRSD